MSSMQEPAPWDLYASHDPVAGFTILTNTLTCPCLEYQHAVRFRAVEPPAFNTRKRGFKSPSARTLQHVRMHQNAGRMDPFRCRVCGQAHYCRYAGDSGTFVTGCRNRQSGTLKLTELTRCHAIKMCQIGKNIENIHRFGDSVLSFGKFSAMGRSNDKNKIGSGAGC